MQQIVPPDMQGIIVIQRRSRIYGQYRSQEQDQQAVADGIHEVHSSSTTGPGWVRGADQLARGASPAISGFLRERPPQARAPMGSGSSG